MLRANRSLWWILLVGILILGCCCIAFAGGLFAFYSFRGGSGSGQPSAEAPIILVTQAATEPAPVATPRATATALRPGEAATPLPTTSATRGAASTPQASGESEALLAEVDLPARDLRRLAMQFNASLGEIPLVVNPTPPTYKVGDKAKFWTQNSDTMEYRQITAELRYITDHVYMWVEQGVTLNQTDLERSAQRFEAKTYSTDREFFGSEWSPGVDNDVHLSILHARGLGERTAGYYSSADEFSRLINPYSNEREMFYVSAESDSSKPNSSYYDGTLAHELQHMIHWANDRNEDSWVNEGMSMLAERLNGFDTGGFDIAYSEKPDTQLDTWTSPTEGNDEHYGASFLFMDYFLDRFGEELTRAVVASPENGIGGFNDALAKAGRPERFEDIFADWVLANYLDRPNADPQGHYGYPDLDPQPPAVSETLRRFPASGRAQVSQYGADYYRLKGRGRLEVQFSGQAQVPLVDAVLQGQRAWWSNRGDDSDATLTRAFDLRNASAATLTFSTWYDLEDGWDYAYVAASTDGGSHWQILKGRNSTDKNPAGNAFGWGWTGMSDGKGPSDEGAEWVQERVDLSAFSGKQILLRFEVVTDDAVNDPGMLIDDIAIPEIGYRDGGENGGGGWDAAGWILTDNKLQQRWLVQLVEIGRNKITVQRMEVGADGQGRLALQDDLSNLTEAILVVSALAPVTTESAPYSYTIAAP